MYDHANFYQNFVGDSHTVMKNHKVDKKFGYKLIYVMPTIISSCFSSLIFKDFVIHEDNYIWSIKVETKWRNKEFRHVAFFRPIPVIACKFFWLVYIFVTPICTILLPVHLYIDASLKIFIILTISSTSIYTLFIINVESYVYNDIHCCFFSL